MHLSIWFYLIIAVFATFRVAKMIAEEDGPAFIFKRLRDRFTNDKSSLAIGIRCPLCVGFWVAALISFYLVWLGVITLTLWPVVWLAVAGAQVKLDQWWKR